MLRGGQFFRRPSQAAFTIRELLAVIVVIIVLAAVSAARERKVQEERRQQTCVNNLKNIGLAYRIWNTGSGDNFPFEASTNEDGTKEFPLVSQHFQTLSNDVETWRLVCPSTTKVPAADWKSLTDANVSYFEGQSAKETFPQSFLSGDSGFLIDGVPPTTNRIELTKDSDVSYARSVHHRAIGNVATGDGSVRRLNSNMLRLEIKNSGLATNVLLLPQ